jgi:hypothetical protein
MSRRLGVAVALALLAVAGAGPAAACAICLSAVSVSLAEEIDATDRAVLAVPDSGGFRVLAVLKGDGAPGEIIPADTLVPAPAPPEAGRALLLLHNSFAGTWKAIGVAHPENAAWLRDIASAPPLASDDDHEVAPGPALAVRLALAVPRFEDADPLVAEIAHDQVARAPYAALASLAEALDPAALRAFIAAPGTAARRPSYILLLGIAGDGDDAAAIDERLGVALKRQDATDLSALLAADMELRGPGRVSWIEATYLADRRRSLPEVEAALTALAVQGEADATVPRAEVVAAFRRFIRARPAMAGFVAPELAHWQAWEASADYAALIEAGAVTDPAEEFAILTYLHRSPDPAAKAALVDD